MSVEMMSIENNINESVLVDFDKFINNNRLTNEFDVQFDKPTLGHGTFGVVIKAKNRIDDKDYAIKLIAIRAYSKEDVQGERTMIKDFKQKIRELKIWAKIIDLNYCVQYRSAWLEMDQNCKNRFLKLFSESYSKIEIRDDFINKYKSLDFAVLHIQMDLCSLSLRSALKQMESYFGYTTDRLLPHLAHYISSELLIEILEAINYLHTRESPIIHRDIKPDNILIKWSGDGRFIKLADFGLAVLHETASQSHTQYLGAEKYMAPEVRNTRKYTTKADIYSIGVMIQELFNFSINRKPPKNMNEKYGKLFEMTGKALGSLGKNRPTCAEMLAEKNEWALNSYEVPKNEIDQRDIDLNMEYDIKTDFVKKFIQIKLK